MQMVNRRIRCATRQPLDELCAGEAVITAPLYSIGEGARYLRVAENTIRSWIDGRV